MRYIVGITFALILGSILIARAAKAEMVIASDWQVPYEKEQSSLVPGIKVYDPSKEELYYCPISKEIVQLPHGESVICPEGLKLTRYGNAIYIEKTD